MDIIKSSLKLTFIVAGIVTICVVFAFLWPFVVAGLVSGWLIDPDKNGVKDPLVVIGSFALAFAVSLWWLMFFGQLMGLWQ